MENLRHIIVLETNVKKFEQLVNDYLLNGWSIIVSTYQIQTHYCTKTGTLLFTGTTVLTAPITG
jgi:hypothetical protein